MKTYTIILFFYELIGFIIGLIGLAQIMANNTDLGIICLYIYLFIIGTSHIIKYNFERINLANI
jgi:hypothetical protein